MAESEVLTLNSYTSALKKKQKWQWQVKGPKERYSDQKGKAQRKEVCRMYLKCKKTWMKCERSRTCMKKSHFKRYGQKCITPFWFGSVC